MQSRKLLIIKLGYSETFVPHVRTVCSLGDVLRTTCVLHLFERDDITWLTDAAALPLLRGHPRIQRLLAYDPQSLRQLESARFDAIVNLEKVPDVCALSERIAAPVRYGFRLDPRTQTPVACNPACDALVVTTHDQARQLHGRPWPAMLYAMLGATWKGEPSVLGYQPRGRVIHDIGFNTHVGSLLPVKAWPGTQWRKLEQLLTGRYSITHQQCLHDLEGYMEWIHSCRLLVTSDSLGLHLGMAMRKKIVALFGPTPANDLPPAGGLLIVRPPTRYDCMPCLQSTCDRAEPCMTHIAPETVRDAVDRLLAEDAP